MDDMDYEFTDANSVYADDDDGDEESDRKKRYIQRYKPEWENDVKFREWLEPIANDPHSAYCNVCCSSLTARKKDLMDHGETRKHKKNIVYKQNNPILYRKMMQNIREVDASVIMDRSSPWTPEAVKVLIQQVEIHHERFYDNHVKKSTIYAAIANEMNSNGFACVSSECLRKWESLRKSYERVLQYQVKGEFKSKFPYFNLIHKFLAKEIDPLGMREKMLCQKLGRSYDPNAPLILDGMLDGTSNTTTPVKKEVDSGSITIHPSFNLQEDGSDHLNLDVVEDLHSDRGDEPVRSIVKEDVRDWEESAVEVLLKVLGNIKFTANMMGPNGRFYDSFWDTVSQELLDYYCEVSPLECRHKWRELLSKYKQIVQKNSLPRSKGRPRKQPYWKYYNLVGDILEKIHAAKKSASKRARDETNRMLGRETEKVEVSIGPESSDGTFARIIKEEIITDDFEDDLYDEPKAKMRRMHSSLLQMTQRIDLLERQVSRKNSANSDVYGPQIVNLLSNILTELKKNRGCNNCASTSSAATGDASTSSPGITVQVADPVSGHGTVMADLGSIANGLSSELLSSAAASSSSIDEPPRKRVFRLDDEGKLTISDASAISAQSDTFFKKKFVS